MAEIFISYSREDRRQANRLAAVLKEQGFGVWWDIDSLRLGASFARDIQQAVGRAKAVVVLWSRHSHSSQWVEAEANLAWKQGKLCSVIIEPGSEVPFPFDTRHALSLESWNGDPNCPALQRLIADVSAVVERSSGQQQQPYAQPKDTAKAAEPEPPPATQETPRPAPESPQTGDAAPRTPDFALPEPEMVRLPPGTFLMGSPDGEGDDSEHPQHEVRIGRAFAIGKYPVTFDEYDAFATAGDRDLPEDRGWGRGRRPVIDVSWEDAVAYVKWLSVKTGKDYRLPTEAEWEYAARAGTSTPWSFGGDESVLREYAWYAENSEDKTHQVGEKRPNPWGLYDVHGNVWEWTQDCWHKNYGGLIRRAPANGSAWESGDCGLRVVRGGSWDDGPVGLRSADRSGGVSDYRGFLLGFRLAQDL